MLHRLRSYRPAARREVGVNEPNGFGLVRYERERARVVQRITTITTTIAIRRSEIRPARHPDSVARRAAAHGATSIKFSRCAARSSLPPSFKYADYGFRVAMTIRDRPVQAVQIEVQ